MKENIYVNEKQKELIHQMLFDITKSTALYGKEINLDNVNINFEEKSGNNYLVFCFKDDQGTDHRLLTRNYEELEGIRQDVRFTYSQLEVKRSIGISIRLKESIAKIYTLFGVKSISFRVGYMYIYHDKVADYTCICYRDTEIINIEMGHYYKISELNL